MNQSWSFIIFFYNEKESINDVINSLKKFTVQNKINDHEIILIDDGSDDGTADLSNKSVYYTKFTKNMGIGKALLTGYQKASKENAVAIPGDGQFDINELEPFINFPDNTFISFYRKGLDSYSPYRKIISKLNKIFNKYFLGLNIRDVNWVKAYKTKSLHEIDLKLESSLISSEICSKLIIKKYLIKESQSVYHQRAGGRSRGASLKTLSQALRELVTLALLISQFKKKNA